MAFIDLFKPKWKHSDSSVRKTAVHKITDHNVIADIAKNDTDCSVRKEAICKLTDQIILKEIALSDTDIGVRKAAINKISNERILLYITENVNNSAIREESVIKQTNPKILADIVTTATDPTVRVLATYNLHEDQGLFTYVAENDTDSIVRKVAVSRLTDQNTLKNIANNDTDSDVRKIAVNRLTDQNLLANIAINGTDSDVRKIAVDRLTDQNLLANITINVTDIDLQEKALNKLTELNVIENIAQTHTDRNVSNKAAQILIERREKRVNTLVSLKKWDTLVREGAVVVDCLIEKLKNQDQYLRTNIVEVLGKIGDIRALEPLIVALKDDFDNVRWGASISLGLLQDERAAFPLFQAFNKESRVSNKKEQVRALVKLGRPAEEFLDEIYRKVDTEIKIFLLTEKQLSIKWDDKNNGIIVETIFKELENDKYLDIDYSVFGKYEDIMCNVTSYEQKAKTSGREWEEETTYTYNIYNAIESVKKLCKIVTPVSSNLLHMVSKRKDIQVVSSHHDMVGINYQLLSFKPLREMAKVELQRRGHPPYEISHFDNGEAWK